MIRWAEARVTEMGHEWPGVQLVVADDDDRDRTWTALTYTDLMPVPRVGDRVLLNTAAAERSRGGDEYALVIAVLNRKGHLAGQPAAPSAGGLVKSCSTGLQVRTAGVDEQGEPYRDQLKEADDIAGMPVVAADQHAALPAILAGIQHDTMADDEHPVPRIAYLMTDEAALPMAFSETTARLREAGWLDATISCGQCYGGDFEAVNVYNGLLAARWAANADVTVVTQGPGDLDTGSRWGFSGVAAGKAINAAASLDGHPVGTLRISGADPRSRHRGLSDHSLTAYGRVALRPADIALPNLADARKLTGLGNLRPVTKLAPRVDAAAQSLPLHRLHRVALAGLDQALLGCPVRLSSMGRDLEADPAYFLSAAAAGRLAAHLLHD